MRKLTLNNALLVIGIAGTFVPDILGASAALAGTGVGWLVWVAKGLGAVALILGGLARAVPKLRPLLASMNLATPHECLPPSGASADVELVGPTRQVPIARDSTREIP
jgi:hypothetical protein